MASPEAVLQRVRSRIVPTTLDQDRMAELADRLQREVEQILEQSNIVGKVTLQGSFARDTWLRGETDLDIFVRFPPSMERREWLDIVLPALRKGLGKYKVVERYAEHPFLEFHAEGVRVNVVPSYDVEKGHWKSATDRTPYHTEFMKASLTFELRNEARYLKKFAKGIGVYGAEIEVGGFSGMLVDTLTVYYRTFVQALTQAGMWVPGVRLEIGKPASVTDEKRREKDVDLVVIDPVDSDRNLAAALRPEKLWSFVGAARQFLHQPDVQFFFPSKFAPKTRAQFSKRLSINPRELVAVAFNHPVLVPDVLWGQLLKIERSLVEMLTREGFEILRSKIWSDEQRQSSVLLELDRTTLPSVKLQKGPPVSKRDDSSSFLRRHLRAHDTSRGPWIEGERWVVEKKRRASTIKVILKSSTVDESYGLAIPKQIGRQFSKTVRLLEGDGLLSFLGRKGFDETLWRFMDAKPAWLRPGK